MRYKTRKRKDGYYEVVDTQNRKVVVERVPLSTAAIACEAALYAHTRSGADELLEVAESLHRLLSSKLWTDPVGCEFTTTPHYEKLQAVIMKARGR